MLRARNLEQSIHIMNQSTHTLDALVSLREAARRLDLSIRAVYRLIARGDLPRPVKVGGASKLYQSDLTCFLDGLKEQRN